MGIADQVSAAKGATEGDDGGNEDDNMYLMHVYYEIYKISLINLLVITKKNYYFQIVPFFYFSKLWLCFACNWCVFCPTGAAEGGTGSDDGGDEDHGMY